MKDSITLTASDGHSFEAYLAAPAGAPKAAVVVIQEIFGVNTHIKEAADRMAAAGYLAIAPALFDRIAPDITLAYDGDGVAEGRGLKEQADANSEFDVKAAIFHVASAGVGHLHGAWPVTKQAALLRRLAIMAVNCHRLQGVMRPVRSWRILAFMTRQFPKRARAALPRRSLWLKRIFMMLDTVLTAIIAASMMPMQHPWLGGGA
jgi:hypothetical protein